MRRPVGLPMLPARCLLSWRGLAMMSFSFSLTIVAWVRLADLSIPSVGYEYRRLKGLLIRQLRKVFFPVKVIAGSEYGRFGTRPSLIGQGSIKIAGSTLPTPSRGFLFSSERRS